MPSRTPSAAGSRPLPLPPDGSEGCDRCSGRGDHGCAVRHCLPRRIRLLLAGWAGPRRIWWWPPPCASCGLLQRAGGEKVKGTAPPNPTTAGARREVVPPSHGTELRHRASAGGGDRVPRAVGAGGGGRAPARLPTLEEGTEPHATVGRPRPRTPATLGFHFIPYRGNRENMQVRQFMAQRCYSLGLFPLHASMHTAVGLRTDQPHTPKGSFSIQCKLMLRIRISM
ncbi:unnamed protein product [Miscanthus lutarioriparius]|uniref:Uncharacterized protein n=1 Tax=Miscanthus lutarioriparius TaxID=422564 RepID=A0A811MU26_9POAL|nr:unnamed protein product [Miscanthus lutarioriparius]